MNTEAQRARNKRKRDKLRAKKRQDSCASSSVLRFRLDAEVAAFPCRCGLLDPQDQETFSKEAWKDHVLQKRLGILRYFSTEWVYMGTHDVSSSALDAIQCFCNTVTSSPGCHVAQVQLLMQLNGTERRKVWRGHTLAGVEDVVQEVFSFVRRISKQEL